MSDVKKTTPSQDLQIAWLAGILDGEGSIGRYTTKQNSQIIGIVIVNTDLDILAKVEEIYRDLNVFYNRYSRLKYQHEKAYQSRKECFEIVVRRRDDAELLLSLVIPHLVGIKKQRAQEVLDYLLANPRKIPVIYTCEQCKKTFTGRKKRYCTLSCWHRFAQGKDNPNYRHGEYVNQV